MLKESVFVFVLVACQSLMAQTFEKETKMGAFIWGKLGIQQSEKTVCGDQDKTIVFVYSDLPNFVLMDGSSLVRPVLSEPFVSDVKKNIFCLQHPSSEFVVENTKAELNDRINVASYIVTTDSKRLAEIKSLIENGQTEQINLNDNTEENKKNKSISSIPPSPATFALSWHKLAPQRIEKTLCDTNKTMVFIYTNVSKMAIQDGENLVFPVTSIFFVENIKQNIFCVEHPGAGFMAPSYVEGTKIQQEAAAFVVSKSSENLQELAQRVEQTIKNQQDSLFGNELAENSTEQIKTFAQTTDPIEEKKQLRISYSISDERGEPVEKEFPAKVSQKDDYGYRVQLMAKLKSDFTQKSIDNYFKIPYKINIDYDGTWYRFLVGYFEKYDDAKALLTELQEKYNVEDGFISLYKNKDTRISIFMQ